MKEVVVSREAVDPHWLKEALVVGDGPGGLAYASAP